MANSSNHSKYALPSLFKVKPRHHILGQVIKTTLNAIQYQAKLKTAPLVIVSCYGKLTYPLILNLVMDVWDKQEFISPAVTTPVTLRINSSGPIALSCQQPLSRNWDSCPRVQPLRQQCRHNKVKRNRSLVDSVNRNDLHTYTKPVCLQPIRFNESRVQIFGKMHSSFSVLNLGLVPAMPLIGQEPSPRR